MTALLGLVADWWPALVGLAGVAWGAFQRWQGRKQGREDERDRAEREAWRQADEAEKQRTETDRTLDAVRARRQLRELAERGLYRSE